MRCRSVLTRVDAHRTGELGGREVERLEQHLETCPSCRESRIDVDELATAVKSLALVPSRSCRDALHEALQDSFGVVDTQARKVRVAFRGTSVRMVDASDRPLAAFREAYARRFGKELNERSVPDPIRNAVTEVMSGRSARLPAIDLSGSSGFERSVLETLRRIPRGEVRTYEWVAEQIGRPRAARAVGNALAHNPVPLLLPCHRVLPSTGRVGRYAFGTEMKRALLLAEGVPVDTLEELGREGVRFVGSSTTKIFCMPTCRDAKRIRDDNRVPFHDVDDALRRGYRACRHCTPMAEGGDDAAGR